MADGVELALYTSVVLAFLQPHVSGQPIEVYEDNEGAKTLAKNPIESTGSKHIDMRQDLIREWVTNKDIVVHVVKSQLQHADTLTKALGRLLF